MVTDTANLKSKIEMLGNELDELRNPPIGDYVNQKTLSGYVNSTLSDGISETSWRRLLELMTFLPVSEEKSKILALMETVQCVDGRFCLGKSAT